MRNGEPRGRLLQSFDEGHIVRPDCSTWNTAKIWPRFSGQKYARGFLCVHQGPMHLNIRPLLHVQRLMRPHTAICVRMLLCVLICRHNTISLPSYYFLFVLILLYVCPQTCAHVSSYYFVCPHPTICVSVLLSVVILLYIYMYPHTSTHMCSYYFVCPHTTTYAPSYYFLCVLILLHTRPHTNSFVSAYYYICVLMLLYMCPHATESIFF